MARRQAPLLFRGGWRAEPPCRAAREGSPRPTPPRRHRPQRRLPAAGRRHPLRHLLDAWRVRRATNHRQHLVSQALLGLARRLQHHAGERPAHACRNRRRVAASGAAIALRDGTLRLPVGVSPRRAARSSSTPSHQAKTPALQIDVQVEGAPCRILVFGHLVLGEHDYAQTGSVEFNDAAKRISFRPDPDWLWGQRYPNAVYHLVTSTPGAIDALGGDDLLLSRRRRARHALRGAPYASDEQAAVRYRRLDDGRGRSGTACGEIRGGRRAGRDAGLGQCILVRRDPKRPLRGRCCRHLCLQHAVPLARA